MSSLIKAKPPINKTMEKNLVSINNLRTLKISSPLSKGERGDIYLASGPPFGFCEGGTIALKGNSED